MKRWLRRDLNTLDLYSLVHADSQSTFYFAFGFIALYSGMYAFLVVTFAIMVMLAVALTYGEIGSRFPETGGSYLYVKHAINKRLGFLSTWLLMLDQAVMVSYGTLDASNYLLAYLGLSIPSNLLAIALSSCLYILTLLGIRESAKTALTVAFIDFLVVGLLLIGLNLLDLKSKPPYHNWFGIKPLDTILALGLASRGFTGLDAIGQLAGEARKPLIHVPRATFIVAIVGLVFSILLTMILLDKVNYHELSKDPSLALLLIAKKTPYIPYIVEPLLVVDIVLIMLMAALAGYVAFSRLAYILANDNLLPSKMLNLHKRFRTPYVSISITYLISILFIIPGELSIILEVYAIGSLINYLIISISLITISKKGKLHGGFMSPTIKGIPITAIFALPLISISIIFNLWIKFTYLWVIGLWLVLGIVIYMARSINKPV